MGNNFEITSATALFYLEKACLYIQTAFPIYLKCVVKKIFQGAPTSDPYPSFSISDGTPYYDTIP